MEWAPDSDGLLCASYTKGNVQVRVFCLVSFFLMYTFVLKRSGFARVDLFFSKTYMFVCAPPRTEADQIKRPQIHLINQSLYFRSSV
jgi:hypothetical protein